MTRRIFLTFDDGPDVEWTPRILDVLAAAEVRATFFVIGMAARACPDLVRRVADAGHELGNHTLSHRHPFALGTRRAQHEVVEGSRVLEDILGAPVKYFRPPHGRVRRCMVEAAAAQGQSLTLWSRSAVDWGPLGHARSIEKRLRRTVEGDIVLMHDGSRGINRTDELIKVLPGFLADMRRRGFEPSLLAYAS